MITDADIAKLETVFATKSELKEVQSELQSEIGAVKEEIGELRVELGEVKDDVQHIRITLDTLAGAVHDQWTQQGARAVHLPRHDRQIAALAQNAHVTLPD